MIFSPSVSVTFLTTEDPRWPLALAKVPHDLFHLQAYLKALTHHEEGQPLLFLLDAGDHGMLVPLFKRSLAPFGAFAKDYYDAASPYGYPAPLYWGANYPAALPEMHRIFEHCLREQNIVSLFLRLSPFLGAPNELLAPLGELKIHGPSLYIDLRDAEGSWKGINDRNRRFINRMLRDGCEVRIDEWASMDTVMLAYRELMARLGASPFYLFPQSFFQELKDEAANHFHLATCYDGNGSLAGGVFFSEVGGLIHYFQTGTFAEFAAISPGKLLINALRIWGLEHGHHTLHLGGGLGAQKDSLYDFKVRMSTSETTFATFRKVLLPDLYRTLCEGRETPGSLFFPAYRQPL